MAYPFEMSVVIITPDTYASIRRTVKCLSSQSVAAQLELVVVAPCKQALAFEEPAGNAFGAVTIVEVGEIVSMTAARLAGARVASAPLIAFSEDHVLYNSQWAEALIDAHRREYAVVGAAFGNANPNSMVSWANLLIEYSEWIEPTARTMQHLPGHNSAYKKAILLAYGKELDTLFESESVLHWDMHARGYVLFLEPRARTFHLNHSLLAPTLKLRFYSGAVFAAARSRNWSPFNRLGYFAGSPLIPLVRLARILRSLQRVKVKRAVIPQVLPVLFFALICDAAGEAIGYTLRPEKSWDQFSAIQYHRERHLNERDRRTWESEDVLDCNPVLQ